MLLVYTVQNLVPSAASAAIKVLSQVEHRVELNLANNYGDLVAELPFILMHPKPVDDPPPIPAPNAGTVTNAENGDNVGIDTDLIRLDTDAGLDDGDDDLIFEDFARLRLRGETDA
ncbi:arrestin_C domain-containing protein [Trichonephila clavipes]|nr:arrestin_C domain-containing protein [Trichonephila clavipes]